MGTRVVCISRTVAAGGETVGRAVAESLGFRYVDEEVITLASEKAQVDPAEIAQAEHRQSLLTRLLDAIAAPALATAVPPVFSEPVILDFSAPPVPAPAAARERYRDLIREAIAEIAAQGSAVIVAHAASLALAGRPDVLRVLVTASPAKRGERLWLTGGLLNERDAATAVEASDRERRDYLLRFHQVREELPIHYDLVVNTDVLTPAQAISAIVAAAKA
jgi:cytidylate kinase